MQKELIQLKDAFERNVKYLDGILKKLNDPMTPPVAFTGIFKRIYKGNGEGIVHIEGDLEISVVSTKKDLTKYCVEDSKNRKTRTYFEIEKDRRWEFLKDSRNFGLGITGCELTFPDIYLAIPIANHEEEARLYFE